ncbi:phage O protein family [Pluralibacter gergoviae]|uniref:Phage O protein family n=1 Tax=Pluralibacter gergoviae TaxID=61647 RepID=A0A0J5KQ50_PLUGE|nr:hypothetical protein [Pluralibacter gergoviae]KMK08154.1 phage O protein family [Pluralibacter gergoviae]
MSLLMPSRPIVINPDLAYSIGLNEAIALQQVNYWLKETNSGIERDGVRWIYNTTEQWLEQFPFWSESTLKRTFTRLKTLGVLRVEQLNKSQRDMTNYYTINYESALLDEVKVTESKRSKCASPSGQNDTMEGVKVKRSIRSKRTAVIGSNCTDDPTENTTEITTEITEPSCPVAAQPDAQDPVTDFLTLHPDAVVHSVAKRQWGTQDDLTCAEFIWSKIITLYEQAAETDGEVVRPKEPNWTAWANEVRLMVAQDGRTHKQICALFKRANRDSFWCRNILSPSKLREKWDELSLKLSPVTAGGAESGINRQTFKDVDYSLPENSGFRS